MEKKFEIPELKTILFSNDDIIVTSGDDDQYPDDFTEE